VKKFCLNKYDYARCVYNIKMATISLTMHKTVQHSMHTLFNS